MKQKHQDDPTKDSSKGKKALKSDDLDSSVTSTLTTSVSTSHAPPPLASTTSSSSALPPTSKNIQKKIDKKLALEEFRMKTKSNTKKTCPSCSLDTHARSTSNLCPAKKQKEQTHNSDEKKETFVIKCSLKNICRDRRHVDSIASVTSYTTKVMCVGSLFINYIGLKLLSKGEEVLIIDHTLVYSIFTLVTGNGKKALKYIQDNFVEFCNECQINEAMLQSLKSIGYSSVLSIVCKQYKVLVCNHVYENHERRTTRFFLEALSDRSSPFFCQGLSVVQKKKHLPTTFIH
ncbi:hypothetical protein RMATCC62417_13182 [Rhizopus microsporus]|nr:hypothetical protein RMATCC62417_13182 [Rhizopus microsporus]